MKTIPPAHIKQTNDLIQVRRSGTQQACYHLTNSSEIPPDHAKMTANNNTDTASGDLNAHRVVTSDHKVRAAGSKAHLNEESNRGEADEPTLRLRSGRIVHKKWIIAQVALRKNKNNVGDSIRLSASLPPDVRSSSTPDVSNLLSPSPPPSTSPKPMSDVFNIPELLEQILLNLETSFLIKKAMLVCRGFKQSLDGSPTFRKRSCFVFRINNNFDEAKAAGGIPRFYVNLRPKWMPRLCETPMQKALHFSFEGSFPWFKFLATMEGLKRLRVFEDMPAIVMVNWNTNGRREVIGRIWLRKNVSGLTFGHVFDSMARSIPDEENVESVEIKWV